MGRKPADLWKHAERSKYGFKCNFCNRDFTGGIVRLRAHLSGTTGQGIQVCSKVHEHVKSAAILAADNGVCGKVEIEKSSSNSDNTLSEPEVWDSKCSSELNNLIAEFFLMNGIDCSVVQSSYFIQLVNALSKSGPGYNLPSCMTLGTDLIPNLQNKVEEYVMAVKQSWEGASCTLISDIWCNDKERRSFISFMACSGKAAVLLNTFEIPNNKLTSSFLEATICFVIRNIGADKIVQYIVDSTQCAELSEVPFANHQHVCVMKCAASEMQSLFAEIHREVEWVRTTLDISKFIVDYMYKDSDILALVRKYTDGQDLKQPLDFKFSSYYGMLQSLLEAKVNVVKLMQSHEWLTSGYDKGEIGTRATQIIENEEFWRWVEEAMRVLRTCYHVLCLVDTHDSSFGYLYGGMEMAEAAISQLRNNNPVKYQRVWEIFKSRKSQIIHPIHAAAAFLNPAYRCIETVEENGEMKEGIDYMLNMLVSADDKEAFIDQLFLYRRILSNPQSTEMIASRKVHSCEWWDYCGVSLPILRKYAIRILNQPCSSSICKSSLSAVEVALLKQQKGLVPSKLNYHLNLRVNSILMGKFNMKKESVWEKIDLKDLSKLKPMDRSLPNDLLAEAGIPCLDDETTYRSLLTSEQCPRRKILELQFVTTILSPLVTGQKVEGKQGSRIHVFLIDPTNGGIVQDGTSSMLKLSLSVLDGDFNDRFGNDWIREDFERNDLISTMMKPLVTGNLQVILEQGMGTLGELSFNYSSRTTRSGKFRLGIKTATADCEGIRIREGISSAFVVEDNEVTWRDPSAIFGTHIPEDSSVSADVQELMERWSPSQIVNDPGDFDYFSASFFRQNQQSLKSRQAEIRWLKLKSILQWDELLRMVRKRRTERLILRCRAQDRLVEWDRGQIESKQHQHHCTIKPREPEVRWLKVKAIILPWAKLWIMVVKRRAERIDLWSTIQKRLDEWRSGVNWTLGEHKLFLSGVKEFGNDWERICQYVRSKTITQVKSHAQMYSMQRFNLSTKEGEKPPAVQPLLRDGDESMKSVNRDAGDRTPPKLDSSQLALTLFTSSSTPKMHSTSPIDVHDETYFSNTRNLALHTQQDSENGVEDRLGGTETSKRRKNLNGERYQMISSGSDDGYRWRKYGQKAIMGSNFPREYYRCHYKYGSTISCLATKTVHRSDIDPTTFEITYRGPHSCTYTRPLSTLRPISLKKQEQCPDEVQTQNLDKGLVQQEIGFWKRENDSSDAWTDWHGSVITELSLGSIDELLDEAD